jgi:hypothetical protein
MKKLLIIFICIPLIFSCGENKKENEKIQELENKIDELERIITNQERYSNESPDNPFRTSKNGMIREYNDDYILINTSKINKYEYTVSISGKWMTQGECGCLEPVYTNEEFQQIISLNPGEKKDIFLPFGHGNFVADVVYQIVGEHEVR